MFQKRVVLLDSCWLINNFFKFLAPSSVEAVKVFISWSWDEGGKVKWSSTCCPIYASPLLLNCTDEGNINFGQHIVCKMILII